MNYCVLIKVSKRVVSFWYKTEGSPHAALTIRETNIVPMYFYVYGNDFFFGSLAKEKFYKNDPNAFGNYFEIIKDPSKHFSIYGNKKPVKQLFYYGVEQFLSYFINTVLYKNDSIESYRHFPLRFMFDADIEDKEKVLIEALFTEAGYHNVERLSYTQFLFEVLTNTGVVKKDSPILLLTSIDNKLFLDLYKNGFSTHPARLELDGQGADARVKILAEMVIEYIVDLNSFLSIDKNKELAGLLPYCKKLLDHEAPILKGEAELTDGNKYWFRITSRNLNERLKYYSNDIIIYSAIDDLFKSNNSNIEATTILLASEELNTPYFLGKLLKKYPNVRTVDQLHQKDAMQNIFSQIEIAKYTTQTRPPVAPPTVIRPNIQIELTRPVMPVKLPPVPPKKEQIPIAAKPALPELKQEGQPKSKNIKLPPIPPKKKD